ncbi:tRNA dihydrouridine synthase [Aequoribacter sp.]|uniref:tRNA dihydrouridine synthase n=1 Tax=Aequoribacter sp. TaxID=2847771 RepID=UPI003F698618
MSPLTLMLAPMEGVIDHTMRALLTRLGPYQRCVTEFLRVTDKLLPERVFYKICPELKQAGVTSNNTPVYLQLLGSNPQILAKNAIRAVDLGAKGIDLNFGCPAKTVNKSKGGASLLQTPDLVGDIVACVRDQVPCNIPVTAKIRLGFSDDTLFETLMRRLDRAAPTEITVHARTKVQGYKPPAHWHRINEVKSLTNIPIVANGEVWSTADALQCASVSGCDRLMLARGALMRPELGRLIRQEQNNQQQEVLVWSQIAALLLEFFEAQGHHYDAKYTPSPVKQWLVYLKHYHSQAALLFEQVKRIKDPTEFGAALEAHLRSTDA